MFSPPHEVYPAADLQAAFSTVVAELQGSQEIARRLHAGRDEFLQLLGDSRKAGKWVAQTLGGLDWDWPRWADYVQTSFWDLTTPAALREQADRMALGSALGLLTLAQLKKLLREHGGQAPAKAGKADVLKAVQALPADALAPIAQAQIQQWLEAKLLACHSQMGARMASRVSHIALERWQLRQRTEPGYLALRPRWEFVCEPEAPRACKRLHGKVLHVQQAMATFPVLPCARLDCRCRVETRR